MTTLAKSTPVSRKTRRAVRHLYWTSHKRWAIAAGETTVLSMCGMKRVKYQTKHAPVRGRDLAAPDLCRRCIAVRAARIRQETDRAIRELERQF